MSAVVARPVAPRAARAAAARRSSTCSSRSSASAAFLYPFWFPAESVPNLAHSGDAPLWAGIIGALALTALALELRRGTMTGMTVAVLGVLAATGGLLRLVSLPLGGNGIFFVVILVGVAFGPRFGLLLGMCAMAVSAVITGGIGPWLPFQMLGTGAMGATAGWLGRATVHLRPRDRGGRRRRVRVVLGLPLRGDAEPVVLAVPARRRRALVDPGIEHRRRRCTTTGRSTSRRPTPGTRRPRSPTPC